MRENDRALLLTYDLHRTLKILLDIDTLPGSKGTQEIYLPLVRQKLHTEGGLKYLQENKDRLLADLTHPKVPTLSREDLDTTAEKARFNGFVRIIDLTYILGEEEEYKDVLPLLWKFSGFNIPGGEEIKTNTIHERTVVWYKLLQRWGGIGGDRLDPFFRRLGPIRHFNLYDLHTWELKPVGKSRTHVDLAKLEEFREYVKDIGQHLRIDLPLPKRLFPKGQEEIKEVTKETAKPASDDYEAFIRNLRVSFCSNSEIKIQEPKKPAKIFNCASLGFRNEEAKTWKLLIGVLQDRDHSYNVGPAHKYSDDVKLRVKNYGNQLKQLDQINIKLGKFIRETYNRQTPKGFKIYERLKAEKPGTYGFKFQIGIGIAAENAESRYDLCLGDELRSKLKNLTDEYKKDPQNDEVKDNLMDAATVAWSRGLLTEDELRNMIQSHRTLDLEGKGGEFNPDLDENRNSDQHASSKSLKSRQSFHKK